MMSDAYTLGNSPVIRDTAEDTHDINCICDVSFEKYLSPKSLHRYSITGSNQSFRLVDVQDVSSDTNTCVGLLREDRAWLSNGLVVTLPISISLDGGIL